MAQVQQQDKNCYLNRDRTACMSVCLDKDDVIHIMLVSTVLKMFSTSSSHPPDPVHMSNGSTALTSSTDYKRENRFLKLPYSTFMKDVLSLIIQAYRLIKVGKCDHKVLMNTKKPDGLTMSILQTTSGRVCLDIR